jgi:peptidoglycan hydrolase CwlO-like protein
MMQTILSSSLLTALVTAIFSFLSVWSSKQNRDVPKHSYKWHEKDDSDIDEEKQVSLMTDMLILMNGKIDSMSKSIDRIDSRLKEVENDR